MKKRDKWKFVFCLFVSSVHNVLNTFFYGRRGVHCSVPAVKSSLNDIQLASSTQGAESSVQHLLLHPKTRHRGMSHSE